MWLAYDADGELQGRFEDYYYAVMWRNSHPGSRLVYDALATPEAQSAAQTG